MRLQAFVSTCLKLCLLLEAKRNLPGFCNDMPPLLSVQVFHCSYRMPLFKAFNITSLQKGGKNLNGEKYYMATFINHKNSKRHNQIYFPFYVSPLQPFKMNRAGFLPMVKNRFLKGRKVAVFILDFPTDKKQN